MLLRESRLAFGCAKYVFGGLAFLLSPSLGTMHFFARTLDLYKPEKPGEMAQRLKAFITLPGSISVVHMEAHSQLLTVCLF